ncbi:MAG: hypothetical protein Q7S40_19945 [Opitutaceae bacterium]|nr:hypothetical protein [Opitutaceae bacterium]
MKSPKNLLLALLALTIVGGALLAWRQYAELVELRAIAMNREERSDFQKKIWDLEKANRDLQDRLAALRAANPGDVESMLAEVTEERGSERGRGNRGDGRGRGGPPPQFTALRELMNKPEVQAMVATQQKAGIEARYAALFKNLNLSPEQAEQMKSLLAERQTSRQDVFEVAAAQGIDPRQNPEALRKLMADSRAQIDSSIKGVIGDTGFAQLQNFEQTMPQRSVVNELQQRLSYSNTPLTATQAEQLVQILAANTPAPRPPPPNTASTSTQPGQTGTSGWSGRGGEPGGRGGDFGRGPDLGMLMGVFGGPGGPGGPGGSVIGSVLDGGRGVAAAPITVPAVSQAQAVLSQPQLSALQQMQKQQQTQQQLTQLVRDTLTTNQPARGSTSGSTKTSGGTAPSTTPPPNQPKRRPGG